MKKLTTLVLLSLFIILTACEKDIIMGEVTGNIYFTGTNIPVPGVEVSIDSKVSHTNDEGAYYIRQNPGKYYLSASKDGFESYSEEIRIVKGTIVKDISLNSTDFTTLVYGVLRGNHSGTPQGGLKVLLLNPDDSESEITDVSDNEGNYSLPGVPYGFRMIVVISEGIIIYQEPLELNRDVYLLDIYLPEPFTFTDPRDNHVYWALKIGSQTWMIENLAWLPAVSGPKNGSYTVPFYYVFDYFGSDVSSVRQTESYMDYGVLYNWEAARISCPDGWHLPGDEEWQELELFLGLGTFDTFSDGARRTGDIGRKLKSKTGWNNNGNGDNSSMLNIYPVGSRFDTGEFDEFGYRAALWTSTKSSDVFAWTRSLGGNVFWVDRDRHDRQNGLSVRCVKDD